MKLKYKVIAVLSAFAVGVTAVLCCGCSCGLELLLRIWANGEAIKDGKAQLKSDTSSVISGGLTIPESADYIYGRLYPSMYDEQSRYIFVIDEMSSELSVALSDFEVTDESIIKWVKKSAEVDKSKYPNGYEPDWEQNYKYYRSVTEVEETTYYLEIAYCVDNGNMYISFTIDYGDD